MKETLEMSQIIETGENSKLPAVKTFKFHNVNKDKIFGNKKQKKNKNGNPRKVLLDNKVKVEDLVGRREQIILNKYIPIKQKVLAGPGSDLKTFETKKTCADDTDGASKKAGSEVNNERGLRLVNINNLLSDPSNNREFTNSSNGENDIQDQPLDLSKKSSECNSVQATPLPLDLTFKSDSFTENEAKIAAPSQQQPMQFLILDKSIIKLVPISHSSSNVNNHVKTSIHKSSTFPNLLQSRSPIHLQRLPTNSRQEHPKSMNSNETDLKNVKEEKPIKKQNTFIKKSVDKKSTESMVKTNETVTKNGGLFCTFKNVKHINLLREQQAKKSSRKKEKNK